MNRVQHLDGWRGLAIVALLTGHFFPNPWINVGRLGVELFFVLSGLLIGEILFVKNSPLSTFYKRRITRILPSYYLFAGTVLGAAVALRRPFHGRGIPSVFLLFANYRLPTARDTYLPWDHLWSVCVEEHTYVILALIALAARATRVKDSAVIAAVIAVFVAVTVALWSGGDGDYYQIYWRTECRAPAILFSALLVCLDRDRRLVRVPGWGVPGLMLAGIGLQAEGVPDVWKYSLGSSLLALTLRNLGRSPRWMLRSFESLPIRYLGLWSFSIYLWQQPFYQFSHRIPAPVGLSLALVLGIGLYYAFEYPVRTWLNARLCGRDDGHADEPRTIPLRDVALGVDHPG